MSDLPAAFVFDLGKVLLDFDYAIAARRLAAQSSQSAEEIRLHLDQSPLLLRYEAGAMTTAEFTRAAMATTGYRGSPDDFGESFGGIFSEIRPMTTLHARLRERWPTFLFSNTNELAIRHIRRTFPFYGHFTGHVLSYEHAAMKPDARIYEAVERLSGCRGPQLVYIDDRPENIEHGRERGWRSILHQSPETTRSALRKFGFDAPLE